MYYLPYNKKLKLRARFLRKNMTPAERRLWRILKTLNLNILRQKPIDNFIIDFYIPSLKLVIEVDGGGHYIEENMIYDKKRTHTLNKYGLKVIRFTNNEVMFNINGVYKMLMEQITPSPSLGKEGEETRG